MSKYNQKLPKEVEVKLDAYIKRIKKIKWFKPEANLDKEKVERDVKVALEAFGVKASIEYRSLKTVEDWDAARDAARDAAWGAADVLALNIEEYSKKYPNGNFVLLIPLWEAGLYPCGVINGKFVIYIPE